MAPFVGAVVRQYEERLTARGRYLLWVTVAFAFLGADTRRTQVYVLFSLAAAGLLVALLYGLLARSPRVRLTCALPRRATALAPLTLRARVTGDAGAVDDLRLHFPRPLSSEGRLAFEPPETFLSVRKGETTEACVEMRPQRRGRYELRGPTLRRCDPLRLVAGRELALPDQALLVYPRYYHLPEFEIPLGRRYQPGGIPLSSTTGDAIEFVGTREYREGDPLRHIHWRSWARRGEPVVKEFQEEYFCRIAIILDTFLPPEPGPADLQAFEAAVSVVASIADLFSRSEYIVDILAAGPDVYEVSAGRSLAYLENILDLLACLEPCREPPFETIGPHLFDKLAQITTVVAVLQDWDPRRREFLQSVTALGTAVRSIVLRAGPTTEEWRNADPTLGEISLMTPADVERAIVADAGPEGRPSGRLEKAHA